MIKIFHMHTYLVCASGFGMNFKIRKFIKGRVLKIYISEGPASYSGKGAGVEIFRTLCFMFSRSGKTFQDFIFGNRFAKLSSRSPPGEPAAKIGRASANGLVYDSMVSASWRIDPAGGNGNISFFYSSFHKLFLKIGKSFFVFYDYQNS